MKNATQEMLNRLQSMGIAPDDASALRRIAMTLHRWHELECGTENHVGTSISIERDESGKPYQRLQYWSQFGGERNEHGRVVGGWVDQQFPVADRERGAMKRLNAIMTRYPELAAYVQGDPRGAALYVYRKDSPMLAGSKYGIESCYSSIGTAVCK